MSSSSPHMHEAPIDHEEHVSLHDDSMQDDFILGGDHDLVDMREF